MKKSKKGTGSSIKPQKISPFSSDIIDIAVDSATLYVHRALVERASPKLLARFQNDPNLRPKSVTDTADLKAFSFDVGHVLVKWLYSGIYQLPEGQSTEGDTTTFPTAYFAATLKIAFGVYSLAREYDLSGLEVLAKEQVALLGSATDVFTFIDVIEQAYPRTAGTHDAWLGEYITTRMKAALKEDQENHLVKATTFETEVVGQEEAETIPIYKLLVQGMLEACRDVVRQISKVDVQATVHGADDDPAPAEVPVEVLPEVFALAVETSNTTEVPATPAEKSTRSSDNDDWVFPSPKGKEVAVAQEPPPEPEPSVPEPTIEDDPWGVWGSLARKKDKKKKGNKAKNFSVVEGPAPEPEPEPEPSVPEATNDDMWGRLGPKNDKKKKSSIWDVEPPLEPAAEPVPVPEPEPELGTGTSTTSRARASGRGRAS
ncbi:hypothetical protein V8F33_010044 [Rhypophila sp. PSN 637]